MIRKSVPPPPSPPVNFHLELPLGPEWRNVDLLRLAILNCLAAVFGDADLSESVGIVTSELLENAIKYGDWTRPDGMLLMLSVRGTGDEVRVEVVSPVSSESPHYANVQSTLAWIERFPTAREAYIARMQAIATEVEKTGESKMGLVRIAYEGPCKLEAIFGERDELRMRASIPTTNRS